ncbi:DUF4160 domain-containing protein [Granulicella sibirica]|uniref:DUF4160 domain-containing protein n=1 Tax=Granulicella sibirica TaxID=2479048 RepID=UPI0010089B2E
MGSVRFDGIVFFVFTRDRAPPHVHAYYGDLTVILELREEGGVWIADRSDALEPRDPKKNEVRRVLRCARANEEALRELWRRTHESSND